MAAQIIQKMIVMAILNQIVKLLPGGSGGGLGGLAKGFSGSTSYAGGVATDAFKTGTTGIAGNYFPSATSFQPFAMGGIVNKPTLFKYADGGSGRFGLMGEAGPEAIIPLKRGRDGKLGVAGGGGVNVTVNVDAQGTKVQGDNNQGQQLGRAVAAAVQQELIKQKRPGGLLA
jgi:lambda family phage tail tape measure protein